MTESDAGKEDRRVVEQSGWPAVSWEELSWKGNQWLDGASHAQRRRHRGPYRAALVPSIAHRSLPLPDDVTALAEDAAVQIARFDAEMGGEIAPFGAILLRSESAASSQIENLTASARAIAEAEIGHTGRRNAVEILGNTAAMDAAVTLADDLDAPAVLAMHRALMGSTSPQIAGRWRSEQVWIGGSALGPHGAMFVPPRADLVEPLIDDLVAFLRRDDLVVIAHVAVAHAQFETIHPFPDGNGRTGRALVHAALRGKGLTRNVTVPVSAGLLTDTSGYFAALTAYRSGDPVPIVKRLADAVIVSVTNGQELVRNLRQIRESWNDLVRVRRDSTVWRVADVLLRRPVVDAQVLGAELGIAPRNVYRYTSILEEAGILTEFTLRRRSRAWRCDEVLAALDAFAARAGRRTAGSGPAGT